MPANARISIPVASFHILPDSQSEVCTQQLYGQPVHILKQHQDWAHVETEDPYRGWVQKGGVINSTYSPNARISSLLAHVYQVKDTSPHPPLLTLSFDTFVQINTGDDPRWLSITLIDGQSCWIHRGDVQMDPKPITLMQMLTLSQRFQGLPYTWGGNSAYGYDCSSYVQMLFRQMGVLLPRDAKDQVDSSYFRTIDGPPHPGDLIFFGKEKITHVALALSASHFIHACVGIERQPATIRISTLSEPYFNARLCAIRRLVQYAE